MVNIDVAVIGGGSAGMAAALSAKENGVENILILEQGNELGGILQQCIHNGFGLQVYNEELTGPSFAQKLIDEVNNNNIDYRLETTVISITKDKQITYVNEKEGYVSVKAKSIILACGCYERNRGAISIPGVRVKGIYTAGEAQKLLNIENILVGKRVFILGSGDIGLIMARRMMLEGAKVLGVAEIMPYSNGLMRNIVQCLKDFDILLYLSHTIIDVQGKEHVEKITIGKVDKNKKLIKGTEKDFWVDTLLLAVGLIPETSLTQTAGIQLDAHTKGPLVNDRFETTVPGIYACGNALHVHDLVDFVTMESKLVGRFVAEDILSYTTTPNLINVFPLEGVNYVLPQRLNKDVKEKVTFYFRVNKPYKESKVEFLDGDRVIKSVKKKYMLPANMERITLKKDEINNISFDLKVRVSEI